MKTECSAEKKYDCHTDGKDELIIRHACRALLLTEENELLLMHIKEPGTNWRAWITPGGGRIDGEEPFDTLRRELGEELHLDEFAMGPHVWNRCHRFDWEDRQYLQYEAFYLIKTKKFTPGDTSRFEDIEKRAFCSFRWWKLDDIVESKELFVPGNLGFLMVNMVNEGPLELPMRVGI